MTIIQTMRNVLDRIRAMPARRLRPLGIFSVVLVTMLLSLGIASPAMARGGDNDSDGLSNADENRYGTDRTIADTDGDGLLDGDEAFTTLTNPTLWDTDRDGLSDGYEVNLGSNPLLQDSDGDFLNDGVEVNVYFTDPLRTDTDNDGLTDHREIVLTSTNPLRWDTDTDGMPDGSDPDPLDDRFF